LGAVANEEHAPDEVKRRRHLERARDVAWRALAAEDAI